MHNMALILAQVQERIGPPILGFVIPLIILITSILLTRAVYRYFVKNKQD